MSVRPKRPGAGLYMSEKRFDRNRQKSERYRKKPSGPRMQQSGKKQSGLRMQQSGNRSGNHENQVQNCNERDQNQKGKRMDRREPSDKTAVKVHKPLVYPCPVFEKCGGCQYLVYSYEEQLHMKQERVQSLLKPYCHVRPVIAMEDPMHYRCKVSAAFGHRRDGSIISGTYQANSHYIVPVDSCLIENETADAIIRDIRALMPSFKLKSYSEDSGMGLVRHVLVRVGHATGQVMVVLVLASPILPSKNNFVKALRKLHPEITTIVLNVNDMNTSMVLGKNQRVLYGRGFIEDELCGCRFRISPGSFFQVNPVQTEKLYSKAMEMAHLTGKENVVDAYCGIGTISLVAARLAGRVTGVELNADAVRDAIENARLNGINNVRFYTNDAGRFMEEMAENGEKADVVFMDPPRSGSTERFMSSVVRLSPSRVVYISCEPATLARDLSYFTGHGYRVLEAVPIDMFPMVENVETVCLLGRRKPDDTIKVSVNMDDYYQIRDAEEAEKNPS